MYLKKTTVEHREVKKKFGKKTKNQILITSTSPKDICSATGRKIILRFK